MPTSDEQITQLFDRFMQAWTANDAVAFGACFTADADYVSYDGTHATGRPALQDNHDRLFRGVLAGSALVGDLESIRHITADVAIVHGMASVLMPWRSKLPKRRLSRQTLVVVRTEQGWRISAIHNGRVRPVTIPAPDAFPSRMSQAMSRIGRRLGMGRPAPGAARTTSSATQP
ncbi:SgcJ/EcaC family oxidoreductase [Streptosporangium sp. NPDC087985]|uniref:SgcJ/EcaC family oxidoreductase n=1 Tax=Streptosporangium sp. NPDC087985 TaxID=3366196 RepID=UPI0037FCD9EA